MDEARVDGTPGVVTGPLAAYESLVRTELTRMDYAAVSVRASMRVMGRLSRWLAYRGVSVDFEFLPLRESDPKPVIRQLASQLGVHHEALRNWIRQDEADRGQRDDRPTTDMVEENRRLRKEVAELRRANEILKAASTSFAQELAPTRRRGRSGCSGWMWPGCTGT